MKTLSSLILGAGFLLIPSTLLAQATKPAGPATGKVLVLDNERTLEGDIERVGDQYRLRRTIGETWVPASRALRLCASIEDALAFLRSRANLGDADEHLRLAQWCRQHELRQQARAEIEEAVRLRPNDKELRRLLGHLQQAAKETPGPAHTPEPVEPLPNLNVELTAETMGQFATRVQPILMNACATCHATGKGGAFRLTRSYEASLLTPKTVQQNLASVLGQINPHQPQNSPFLTKALNLHGEMASAPFRNRQAPAYRALEDWVRQTVSTNPALVPEPTGPAVAPEPRPVAVVPSRVEAITDTVPRSDIPHAVSTPMAAPQAGPHKPPEAPKEPEDPNDPDIFNREVHGTGKPAPPAAPPEPPGR